MTYRPITIGILIVVPIVILWGLLSLTQDVSAQAGETRKEILELNDAIQKKKEEIEKLRKQADAYKKNIAAKQQQVATLENQLSILERRLQTATVEVKITRSEIEETELELDQVQDEIGVREQEIALAKNRLAEQVRLLDHTATQSPLEAFLTHDTFSGILTYIKTIEQVQRDLLENLTSVKDLRERLEKTREGFQNKKTTLEHLEERIVLQQQELKGQQRHKETLLTDTKKTEALFQGLLAQLRAEQQGIDADIANLERTAREKLRQIDSRIDLDGKVIFSWPVPPTRGISAYFHDPSYPFRYVFEHPAIDVRAGQGTPIKAAAPGYVARARDAGLGYSYIMLIHASGYATVYGHVSKILVKEDMYVDRDDIIGLSGGAPGTAGAGRLTTGPHLHFEIRLNGVPINPLDYLL